MASKVPEAADLCHKYIIDTSKNPDALKFLGDYKPLIGKRLTHNNIYIDWQIMGMNTYGAVLRHELYCAVSCKPDKGCAVQGLTELN